MYKYEWWMKTKHWFRDSFPGIMRGFIMVVIVAAVICCIIGFFSPKFEYLDENNLVITFLGSLAAFVVISNYAQMVEIRKKTEDDIRSRKKDMDIMEKKISAILKKYGVDEVAIMELFDYRELAYDYFGFSGKYNFYVVRLATEIKPVFVGVGASSGPKKAYIEQPKDYLEKYYKNDQEETKKRKDVLISMGFPKSEVE